MSKQDEIINKLTQDELVTAEQIADAQQVAVKNKKKLEEVLSDKHLLDTEKFTEVKASVFGLPYENLMNKKVGESTLNIIPQDVAENYKIICFESDGKKIKIGIIDPENFKAFEAVNFLAKETSYQVAYSLISEASFNNLFKQYRTLGTEVSTALKTRADEEAEFAEQTKDKKIKIEEAVASAPIAKIVSVIIRHAVEGKASDIHIEPLPKESRVRYRIDGILHTSLLLPINIHEAIIARIKVLANLKLDETRVPQDGRIRQMVSGRTIDFRVSIIPLLGTEKVVMRILDVTKKAPTLEELGFMGRNLEIMLENSKKTNKLFLVTGPTGSGKSTTLYSILDMLNKEKVNISTLEDPVEYFMKGINQSQVKADVGFTFSSGLRSLLRQDPDILMVGEIRDSETAELAVHSSLTGHFVLSTMHTNDAFGAIPRLLDMDVEPFLLSQTLNTVVAQRLARKICEHCKVKHDLPKEVSDRVDQEINKIPLAELKKMVKNYNPDKLIFYKGKGCVRCSRTGYSGRVAIAEVINVNPPIQLQILKQEKPLTIEYIRESQPFVDLGSDGIIKALLGLTTMEEVMRVMST